MDEDPAQLRMMGEAAFEKAQEFRREKVIEPYLEFIRQIIAATDSRFRGESRGDRLAA